MECLVIPETNLIYFDSSFNLEKVKKGDFLQLESSPLIFQISNCEKVSYSYPVKISDGKLITSEKLNNVSEKDSLKLVCEAYEIDCGLVLEPGTKFSTGSEFAIGNGSIIIQRVDGLGRIQQIKVGNKGLFFDQSLNKLNLPSEQGKESKIEIVFKSIGKRSQEITPWMVRSFKDSTEIFVRQELGTETGSLFYEKYEVTLSTQIPKEFNQLFYNCSLYSEYTEYLSLPFLIQNNLNQESIINKNFYTIDSKIKELDQRIRKLEFI